MFGKKYGPIGVDLGSGHLRAVQLAQNGQGLFLHAGGIKTKPDQVKAGTPEWQRWAMESLREIIRENRFKGIKVMTALPSDDLFIDQVRVSRSSSPEAIERAAFAKVQNKLPFKAEEGLLKYVFVEQPETAKGGEIEVVVMGASRLAVEVHLAIYEQAGLEVAGMVPWPLAMISSYTCFFCRRRNEQDRVSMLMSLGTHHCNIVICRSSSLLFARVVPIGFAHLRQTDEMNRLIAELDACTRYFQTMSAVEPIERLLFLAGSGVGRSVCEGVAELAQRLQIAAQVGDVLSAIRVDFAEQKMMIDRRNAKVDWSLTFGLALQGLKAGSKQA